jgi:hypothetical protein
MAKVRVRWGRIIVLPAHDRAAWEKFFGGAPGCVKAP